VRRSSQRCGGRCRRFVAFRPGETSIDTQAQFGPRTALCDAVVRSCRAIRQNNHLHSVVSSRSDAAARRERAFSMR
jgi:hypothetical protein